VNAAQIAAIERFTNRITRHSLDGPVVFKLDQHAGGPLLFATNVTGELKWYEKSVHVGVLFGPRGGATILSCNGIDQELIQ